MFNVETTVGGYHAYQGIWVTIGKKLSHQRKQANFKDPFAAPVIPGKQILGREKFAQFA